MYTSSVGTCASPSPAKGRDDSTLTQVYSWSTLFSREREIDHNQTTTPPRNKQNSFDRVFCLFGLLPVSECALESPQLIFSVAKSAYFLRCTIFVCLNRDTRIILETTSLAFCMYASTALKSPCTFQAYARAFLLQQADWTCPLISIIGPIDTRLRRSSFPWIMRVVQEHFWY